MRRVRKLWFLVLVTAVLSLSSPAQAQYPFRTFGGGYIGNYGGYGYGNLGVMGAYGYPWGYAWGMPGFTASYSGMPFMSSSYFNQGWNYASPYYSYNYYRSEPSLVPGFGVSDPIRSRLALYPAIVAPSREVIAAALATGDRDRAHFDMNVPTADAKIYLDGVLTTQTGLHRTFVTPKLQPGSRYFFNVEVVWQSEAGRSRTLRRQINLRAGDTATFDFREPD